MLLFIKCHPDHSTNSLLPSKELDIRIREQIAKDLSRRHVPAHIFEVPEIPYNVNGKKMEIQVKAVLNSGESATTKQRLNQQELATLKQFVPFYHLEALLKKLERNGAKL